MALEIADLLVKKWPKLAIFWLAFSLLAKCGYVFVGISDIKIAISWLGDFQIWLLLVGIFAFKIADFLVKN